MSWLASIGAFFKGLTEIIQLGRELWAAYKLARKEGWINDGVQLVAQIKAAKTDSERRDLVRRLVEHSTG